MYVTYVHIKLHNYSKIHDTMAMVLSLEMS